MAHAIRLCAYCIQWNGIARSRVAWTDSPTNIFHFAFMRLPTNLPIVHQQTYEKIFHPSATEALEWREVRGLFREIAQVKWEANGDFKVTRNGHVLVLRPAPTKDVSGADELLELRSFLEHSDAIPPLLDPAEAERQNPPLVKSAQPDGSVAPAK
jgi:hypothetical protein